MLLKSNDEIKQKPQDVFTETSIGNIKRGKYTVDVTFDRSHHCSRIKISSGKDRKGYGTSIPISDSIGPNPSFDDLINQKNVKLERDSSDYLPLIAGFSVMHYNDLLAVSDSSIDSMTRKKINNRLSDSWKEYYDEFSDCSKHAIKIAADKFLEDKK